MDRTARITLVATGLGLFMIFLDALIVNVGLPSIQASFGVGEAGLQWVVAAYSLGNSYSSNISNELSLAQAGFWLLSLGLWTWAIIELGCIRGSVGPNEYGPDPVTR